MIYIELSYSVALGIAKEANYIKSHVFIFGINPNWPSSILGI